MLYMSVHSIEELVDTTDSEVGTCTDWESASNLVCTAQPYVHPNPSLT